MLEEIYRKASGMYVVFNNENWKECNIVIK